MKLTLILFSIIILLQNDAFAQNSVYRSGATPLNVKEMVRKEQQQMQYYNSRNQQRQYDNSRTDYYNKSSSYSNYGSDNSNSYRPVIGNYKLSGNKPANEYERKIAEARMLDQMRLNNNIADISRSNREKGRQSYQRTLENARLAQARMEARRNKESNRSFVSNNNNQSNRSYKGNNYSGRIYNTKDSNSQKKEKSGFSFVPKVFTSYK